MFLKLDKRKERQYQNQILLNLIVILIYVSDWWLPFIIIHLSFVDAIVTDVMDSVVTDQQYATIDQLHEVVPVSVKIPKILPITVEDFGKYVLDCHKNGDEELKIQYKVDE